MNANTVKEIAEWLDANASTLPDDGIKSAQFLIARYPDASPSEIMAALAHVYRRKLAGK